MKADGLQADFLELLDRHLGIPIKVAGAYCRDRANREDLVQEIVAQLWRSFARYDGRVAFSTWMYRVALNVAISFYRQETRRTKNVELRDPAVLEGLERTHEPGRNEALDTVLEHVNQLDELDRAVMILYLDDEPYAEIASILGISETNVATKISRIKERLRRKLWNSTN